MNIFRIDDNPVAAAQMQCNSHVCKMIVESAQMLSTAHRVLDGSKVGKTWVHPFYDDILYKASHINHPCNIWIREGIRNYMWLYDHFEALSHEYTFRYGKIHKTWSNLGGLLFSTPSNIPQGLTPFKPAVGYEVSGDMVKTYRDFYAYKRHRMKMVWTKREQPDWFDGHCI